MSAPRCERCRGFAREDPDGIPYCCNPRCPESWQAAREEFGSSLLGGALAQVAYERKKEKEKS